MERNVETQVRTPDGQTELLIPPGSFLFEEVQVRVRNIAPVELPDPPSDVRFLRGIQINTLASGIETQLSLVRPVTLRVPLTPVDVALSQGRPETLVVLRHDQASGDWEPLQTLYVHGPPTYLEATVVRFSFFAVGVSEAEEPEPTPTATPTPAHAETPTPTATAAPVAMPTAVVDAPTEAGSAWIVAAATAAIIALAFGAGFWLRRRAA